MSSTTTLQLPGLPLFLYAVSLFVFPMIFSCRLYTKKI